MLSNAETMAPELQSTQPAVSAKRDKKKKKSEAVVVDEQPAVSSGNQTRPDSPQGDEAKSKNLYVEAISKRLRNLKKKLGKLEQYDAVPKDQLNVDQQQALSKRPELQATFKELEDIVKQFNLLDAEEIKAEKVAREQREKEEQAKIERAVHDEKRQNDINTSTLLRTIIALNRLTAIPQTVQLSPEQWQTLVYFKQVLTGEGTLDISIDSLAGPAIHHLTKYVTLSPEPFVSTISYADIYSLVELIINPPPPPAPPVFGLADEIEVNGVQDEIPDAVPVITSEEGVVLLDEAPTHTFEEEEEIEVKSAIAIPEGGIRFGNLSNDEEAREPDSFLSGEQTAVTNGITYQIVTDEAPVTATGAWSEATHIPAEQEGAHQYAELAAVEDITPIAASPPGGPNGGFQQAQGWRGGYRGGPRGGFRGGFRGAPFRGGRGNGRGAGGRGGWSGQPRGRGGNAQRGQ